MGKGDGYRVVAYRGDTQQGPYEGAFVFTRDRDAIADPKLRARVDASVSEAGMVPERMVRAHHTPHTAGLQALVGFTPARCLHKIAVWPNAAYSTPPPAPSISELPLRPPRS